MHNDHETHFDRSFRERQAYPRPGIDQSNYFFIGVLGDEVIHGREKKTVTLSVPGSGGIGVMQTLDVQKNDVQHDFAKPYQYIALVDESALDQDHKANILVPQRGAPEKSARTGKDNLASVAVAAR